MSVTNGMLRIAAHELERLRNDGSAFETRCRNYDHPDYLDLDKAGYELLFILDPSTIEYDNPDAATPYPGIAAVLGGGEVIHPDVDLGTGPARLVAAEAIATALAELEQITLDDVASLALQSELLPEVLMCEVDRATLEEYHWPYLQSLCEFLADASAEEMAVLRY